MPETDSIYVAAERRIEWLTVACGFVGAVFASIRWGWRSGAGVVLGTALTWLNFRWLKQGVGAIVKVSTSQAGREQPRVPRVVYFKFFGRLVLLLGVVYVILSRSILPVAAVLAGLFAIVGGIMIEMLWQLVRSGSETETHT